MVAKFYRMFIAYAANVNDFKLRCRMILFMDDTHLCGPYKGTFLAACSLDGDNHLFNFAYDIVCGDKIEEWMWFLEMATEYLEGLKSVIMLDRNRTILVAVV